MPNSWLWVFLVAAGIFSICGAAFEWNFFMNHHKARGMAKLLGRGGTRVFYIVLGLFISVIGASGLLGMLQ
jgi:Immunity protein 17